LVLPPAAGKQAVLRFDTIVSQAPAGTVTVTIGMACKAGCGTPLPATALFTRLAGKGKQTVKIPLACFTAKGVDLAQVDTPFAVHATGPFAAAFANIDIAGGAAGDAGTVRCEDLQ
jgi:beta-glucosidase